MGTLYNSYTIPAVIALIGFIALLKDKKITFDIRFSTLALVSPFLFNVIALYFGHSVLFVQGIIGDTWFNVRYGMMMMPAIAIFVGYLADRVKGIKIVIAGIIVFTLFFAFSNRDAVSIDDAMIGASGKNVAEVSGWLKENAANEDDYILISVASHDAIIFSSGLPMKRYIHEGTDAYWKAAIKEPDKWARYIILRTNDMSDMTFREIKDTEGFKNFTLVDHYPFADIYELKPEYVPYLKTGTVLKNDL